MQQGSEAINPGRRKLDVRIGGSSFCKNENNRLPHETDFVTSRIKRLLGDIGKLSVIIHKTEQIKNQDNY